MAKRGYKLQEFVAHSASVNCLRIGKKACRLFITGGEDHNVNLWTIGKPTSLMSLCGHTSAVESLAFDSAEVLVIGGASNGAIKLWNLEQAKMVRALTGHRSNCSALEFHPFGEFFASGSSDMNLKIWDIRKKGCVHTYKGHSQGISAIKFTPDGRWVVSGGFDNVVKVWDLTAGKLLHDFTFHEGHIRSLDFHPLEFLLATGSADRTVKFWDLETFELIGATRYEATGVRSMAFHSDGRTLFAGFEDSLKVYSWEPVICHDAVETRWTTLGDLCIHDGKLLGCSYYRNSVGVWVADISHIEPYGSGLEPKKKEGSEHKLNIQGSQLEKVEVDVGPTSRLRCMSPDNEPKDIKNIYIVSSGGKPVALQRSESTNSLKVEPPEDSKDISNLEVVKQSPATGISAKSKEQGLKKSFIVPNVVPQDFPDGKDSGKTAKETITFSRTKPGMLLRPVHSRRASTGRFDIEKFSPDVDSGAFGNTTGKLGTVTESNFQMKLVSEKEVKESCEDKHTIDSVTKKFETMTSSSHKVSDQKKFDQSSPCKEETSPVKYVNGVAVVQGRTRSLVERFERREKVHINEDQYNASLTSIYERKERNHINENQTNASPAMYERRQGNPINENQINASPAMYERRQGNPINENQINASPAMYERRQGNPINENQINASSAMYERRQGNPINENQINAPPTMIYERRERIHIKEDQDIASPVPTPTPTTLSETDQSAATMNVEPQISGRDSSSANEGEIIEGLMETHDVTLSTLRSRLTKLQVVRHFWERRDINGAINALTKLPDQSVQADVISILGEKMEILTLDLFSSLLPVLTCLLDSKIERHVKVSLDLLLKLVAVFGPTIHSTISAPPSVGVDLHREERRESCNQCFMQLQKIQKILPILIRRGGILARSAMELNLVLQQS